MGTPTFWRLYIGGLLVAAKVLPRPLPLWARVPLCSFILLVWTHSWASRRGL